MITFTITISNFVAALLIFFAVLILACFIWLISLVYSIADDFANLNYIDQIDHKLSKILKNFDAETKK